MTIYLRYTRYSSLYYRSYYYYRQSTISLRSCLYISCSLHAPTNYITSTNSNTMSSTTSLVDVNSSNEASHNKQVVDPSIESNITEIKEGKERHQKKNSRHRWERNKTKRDKHTDTGNETDTSQKKSSFQIHIFQSSTNNHTNNNHKPKNFQSMMQTCKSVRYKVHRPLCGCPIVKQAKQYLNLQIQDLDGLLVLPEGFHVINGIKLPPSIYICENTQYSHFINNVIGCETKLKNEIFHHNNDDDTSANKSYSNIKVRCAECLLAIQPNGFICLSSQHQEELELVKNIASHQRKLSMMQNDGKLHADHAHYLCILHRDSLWNYLTLHHSQNKIHQNHIKDDILRQFYHQNETKLTQETISEHTVIKLGHHLTSLLYLTSKRDAQNDENCEKDSNNNDFYLVLLVYNDTSSKQRIEGIQSWKFDIPGGKRYLGETPIEGAIRETAEEMSLQIDESWILNHPFHVQIVPDQNGVKNVQNIYYMAYPPSNSQNVVNTKCHKKEDMDNLLPFWTNTGCRNK